LAKHNFYLFNLISSLATVIQRNAITSSVIALLTVGAAVGLHRAEDVLLAAIGSTSGTSMRLKSSSWPAPRGVLFHEGFCLPSKTQRPPS
jgi:hypothetical protein